MTGFCFTVHVILKCNITTTGPTVHRYVHRSPQKTLGLTDEGGRTVFIQVLLLSDGTGGTMDPFFLLIVSTEERSNGQEEEKCNIKSSVREELTPV